MVSFRVVTYNVLSSHLAEPFRFPECEPRHLNANTRLRRVMAKLEPEILENAVVCLQEVSTLWLGKLHVFFSQKNYALVSGTYGTKNNGYMGVVIAWPYLVYEAVNVDIRRLSDTRRWGRPPRDTPPPEPTEAGPLDFLMKLIGMKRSRGDDAVGDGGEQTQEEDYWQMAERRYNQALFIRLRQKIPHGPDNLASGNSGLGDVGGSGGGRHASSKRRRGARGRPKEPCFCVGTYHMPCLFNHRPVMVMHTSLLIRHLACLAREDPLVIAGDFNFNPHSECYKLVTQGDLDENSPDFPLRPPWESDWSPATGVQLTSAYKEANGEEPEFTNNAKVEDWPPFIDTIDYIFHTPGLRPKWVLPLKRQDELRGPYPAADEPSDHVMLAAVYEIN